MSEPVPLSERRGPIAAIRRQWPWALSMAVLLAGLAVIATGHWRRGLGVVGGALLIAAGLRLILKDPGILAMRNRPLDVILYGLTGAGIVIFDFIITLDL